MRIKIKLSGVSELTINNQSKVNSFIHRCLGKNNIYHDVHSDYVVSNLRGGKLIRGTNKVNFSDGCFIVVSSLDNTFINKLLIGLMSGIEFGDGIRFLGIENIDEVIYDGYNYFRTLTPILLKVGGEIKTLEDKDYVSLLELSTKRKLLKIDSSLDLSNFSIEIVSHPKHKVRSINIKGNYTRCSDCQLTIRGSKAVCEILYEVGIGKSTGSGFGLLYKTESSKLYR